MPNRPFGMRNFFPFTSNQIHSDSVRRARAQVVLRNFPHPLRDRQGEVQSKRNRIYYVWLAGRSMTCRCFLWSFHHRCCETATR